MKFGKTITGITLCLSLMTGHSLLAEPFTDNGDGTVTDTGTNLRWQKCSGGLIADATCSGTAATYTWQNALIYCSSLTLAGRSWRVPSVEELKSIIDEGRSNPSIDTTYFPGTVSNGYWTSTTHTPNAIWAWMIYFWAGRVTISSKTDVIYVRCVSTGP
jgi:hypothetical protein